MKKKETNYLISTSLYLIYRSENYIYLVIVGSTLLQVLKYESSSLRNSDIRKYVVLNLLKPGYRPQMKNRWKYLCGTVFLRQFPDEKSFKRLLTLENSTKLLNILCRHYSLMVGQDVNLISEVQKLEEHPVVKLLTST